MRTIAMILIILGMAAVVSAQPFVITRSAVTSGGRASGGTFAVDSTSGESGCGGASGGGFSLTTGFYGNAACMVATPPPTAATVSIGGRIVTPYGRGLANATVTLTDQAGIVRTVRTARLGSYLFENINVGETVIISVRSRRYVFTPRVVIVNDMLGDIDFVADGSGSGLKGPG